MIRQRIISTLRLSFLPLMLLVILLVFCFGCSSSPTCDNLHLISNEVLIQEYDLEVQARLNQTVTQNLSHLQMMGFDLDSASGNFNLQKIEKRLRHIHYTADIIEQHNVRLNALKNYCYFTQSKGMDVNTELQYQKYYQEYLNWVLGDSI